MLNCFTQKKIKNVVVIQVILKNEWTTWLNKQSKYIKNWLESTNFSGDAGQFSLIPNEAHQLSQVIFTVSDYQQFWSAGSLPLSLPPGDYCFSMPEEHIENFTIAWGLGAYQFTQYKKSKRQSAKLVLASTIDLHHVVNMVESIYWVRDLINTPTDDMGPSELAKAAGILAKKFNAKITHIIGEKLLTENYAAIHTVGRASDDAPRLIDLRWGNKKHPHIVLVGKGVCFDTGGLDIKNASNMQLMKKDMGGAAHVLGLARMIMTAKLPIYLCILIPAVENSISGNAYRPGDVITSRKGLTIEIGNTDAEGRVILADALTAASFDKPKLLIDFSTLTGAARVALGTDIPVLFSNDDEVAHELIRAGELQSDPMWRLPLYAPYRELLNSNIADINNAGDSGYAGAIIAALFLKEFVLNDVSWVHFDLMAWNVKSRPGRPQGGEAMGLRAVFYYLKNKF